VRARALADEAVALARRIGVPIDLVYAERALARVLLAQEGAETGATGLAPLVMLERAALARLEGDSGSCERILREAKTLFVELGAPLRVQQIDALLAG
jgi:hypothetical protein